jgi:uncharacterized protein YegJ (DUF2314 family)
MEMAEAMRAARASLRIFLEAFKAPKPGQRDFHLKVRLMAGDEIEHIWLSDLRLARKPFSGILANAPQLSGLRRGQRVTFTRSDISDWMFMQDGRMIGGYTTKVLLRMQRRDSMGDRLRSLVDRRMLAIQAAS